MLETADEVTENLFLGAALRVRQPANGYRAGREPVLLAASVMMPAGECRVLDAGAGVGTAALCLAHRCHGGNLHIDGLELQPALVALARENTALNGLDDMIAVHQGDVRNPPSCLVSGSYDQVIANPPFFDPAASILSPQPSRAGGRSEVAGDMADWVEFLLRMVRHKGAITLIQRADRLDELLNIVDGRAGGGILFPLWPKDPAGEDRRAAKLVLLRLRKGVAGPFSILPGLVMHRDDGSPTDEAQIILRDGGALLLD